MTHGLKEFTREYMEMKEESIAQYRIYNKYKVIWTIKGEDLLWRLARERTGKSNDPTKEGFLPLRSPLWTGRSRAS